MRLTCRAECPDRGGWMTWTLTSRRPGISLGSHRSPSREQLRDRRAAVGERHGASAVVEFLGRIGAEGDRTITMPSPCPALTREQRTTSESDFG